jgi:hypothetical protein
MARAATRRIKPNFFIVGAPKCGTSAWVEYLGSHPAIYFSPVKEPHYFCSDFPGWQLTTDEQDYLDLFDDGCSAKIRGEASVRYLRSEVAAREIREFNPDSRILILVRDQEDYLPSQHNQMVYNGDENIEDFEQAWRLSGKRNATNISPLCREPKLLDYVTAGNFSDQVERYFDEFGANQVRVFHFRDWTRNPRGTYVEILRFLGVEDNGRMQFPPVNEARHHRTRFIVRLVRNPPRLVRAAVAALKRLSGRSRLGLADWAIGVDARKGSLTKVDAALKQEIRRFYRADNLLLERRICKVGEPGTDGISTPT